MREYALLVPMPGTEGRKSHPARTHIPVQIKIKNVNRKQKTGWELRRYYKKEGLIAQELDRSIQGQDATSVRLRVGTSFRFCLVFPRLSISPRLPNFCKGGMHIFHIQINKDFTINRTSDFWQIKHLRWRIMLSWGWQIPLAGIW